MTIITLTTDFGYKDNFVGVMKGVILGIAPTAVLVDLNHGLTAHDITQAAFSIYTAADYFPPGTIHLIVVDPGVGASRAVLALKTRDRIFIAPDNGLLSYIIDDSPDYELRQVVNQALFLASISRTFHGRDIMAPVAANLAAGVNFKDLGPPADNPVRLPPLKPERDKDGLIGRVIYVDVFGNLITNLPAREVQSWPEPGPLIQVGPISIIGLSGSYAEVTQGSYLALIGSHGFLEIARNQNRAEATPDVTAGAAVRLKKL